MAPAIGLDAKVIVLGWHEVVLPGGAKDVQWDVAAFAAGWHKNSSRPGERGNVVISGHHSMDGEVFRYLVSLKPGDALALTAAGRRFDYTVVDAFTVQEKGVSYEQQLANARWIEQFDDERVTLVTCWPYNNNTHRVFVIAKPAGR